MNLDFRLLFVDNYPYTRGSHMSPILATTVIINPVDDDVPMHPDPLEDDLASAQSRRYLRALYDSEVLYDNHSR